MTICVRIIIWVFLFTQTNCKIQNLEQCKLNPNKEQKNQFLCYVQKNVTICQYGKEKPYLLVPLTDWKNGTVYNDSINLSHIKREKTLNINFLEINRTYQFSVCTNNSSINQFEFSICNHNKVLPQKACKNWRNFHIRKKKNIENITVVVTSVDTEKSKTFLIKSNQNCFGGTHFLKLHKQRILKSTKPSVHPSFIKIICSDFINVAMLIFLNEFSNLEIVQDSNNSKRIIEGKNCPSKWQSIIINLPCTNSTTLSIKRILNSNNVEGYWAISQFSIVPINKNQYLTKSAKGSNYSSSSNAITTNNTSTLFFENTTKSNFDNENIRETQIWNEINKSSAIITKNPDNTNASTHSRNLNTVDKTNIQIALSCLLIVFLLTLSILGYLCFAFAFTKYPFEVKNNNRKEIPKIELREKNIYCLSEDYKKSKIRTVRSKAEIPVTESQALLTFNKTDEFSTSIRVADFEEYLMKCFEKDSFVNPLTKQYQKLVKEINTGRNVNVKPSNDDNARNCYKNCATYNSTRIVLKDTQNNYINANYIEGYEVKKAFIATQAPFQASIDSFWLMIWQENVKNIIMLNELVENGLKKSDQYWPELHEKTQFGKILVKNVAVTLFADYITRQFEIECNNETRLVQHYQYTTWFDFCVPFRPQSFTSLIKKVLLMSQTTPIVVHCYGDSGRTGILILCDIVLRMAAKEKIVDFVKTLIKVRHQKKYLVNDVNQYIFAHFVVLECLFGVNFSIPVNDHFQEEVYKVLRKTTVRPLMMQLDKVTEQFKKRRQILCANRCKVDKIKNRFSTIIPGHTQIYLPPTSINCGSNYINAISVDCYICPKKFIVTQQPLPNTLSDFWIMVSEFQVNTIVSLNEIEENDKNCPQFWLWKNSIITLQIVEEIKGRTYDIIKLKIIHQRNNTNKTVNIITMKNWKRETSYPQNPKDLILLWKEMFNTSWKGSSQIIVTCYDGATASGLFVALAYLLEKINIEQCCDVYSAVRTVRHSREQFVQEWGQLEFLYKAAKVYIEDFDNYDNFNN